MHLDDESKRLWEEFRKAEMKPCCRIVNAMIKRGFTYIVGYIPGKPVPSIKIKYCPGCGRKIDSAKLD